MKKNNLKEKLKAGQVALGSWNVIPSASIVEIAGNSGLDFIIIDSEHGPIGFETAEDMARAAKAAGITPIMRVPANEPHLILKALDIGSSGVQVPHISTKKDAKAAAESAKYYPKGKRGLSPFTRAAQYGMGEKTHVEDSNENAMVILNVEGVEGIKNLKQIATVPDVDVIFIGPYDLSQSIGKPGQVYDPKVINSIKDSVKIIRKNNMACGSFARDKQYLKVLIDCGVQYITYMVDSAMISESYCDMRSIFNKLITGKGRK